MSSLRKLQSARTNGAKSRGPVTAECKERSAMNGLRHGFAAHKIVLATEDRPQFDAMRDAFIEKHQPTDEVESSLVDEMVVANWRLHRIWAGEAAMFDRQIQALLPTPESQPPPANPETLFGQAFEKLAGNENALKLLMRYEANCRWQYDRALRNLLSLRKTAKDQAYDGPIMGPGTDVRFYFCPNKGGKCSEGNTHELCPRTEITAAVPIGEKPPDPPQPTEPSPTNEHRKETGGLQKCENPPLKTTVDIQQELRHTTPVDIQKEL
jgi:hypothetical protein